MERNNLIKKGVAVAVILLFIGLAFAPSINAQPDHPIFRKETNGITHIIIELSHEPELSDILGNYRKSMIKTYTFNSYQSPISSWKSRDCYQNLQLFTLAYQDYISEIINVVEHNDDARKKVQQLSLYDDICNFLGAASFWFGWIATYFDTDMIIFWVLWTVFAPLSLLCIALDILLGCPHDPFP